MIISLVLPIIYGLPFWFSFVDFWSWLWFVVGLYLGFNFHIFDYLLCPFYGATESKFESEAKKLLKEKKYFSYLKYALVNRKDADQLLTKSIIFVAISIPLALFMITSSGSQVGIGLTLGLCLANAKFMYALKYNSAAFLNFFGKSYHLITEQHLQNAKAIYLVCFGLLSVFMLLS